MWDFFKHKTGQPNRDPIEGEFFSDHEYERTARHLIRESIQNSLDAKTAGKTAMVRFAFGRMRADADEFLTHILQEHVHAMKHGYRRPPEVRGGGRFMTIEDFGTCGLTGDIARMTDRADGENHGDQEDRFYYFWRNVGRNEKAEGARGTWGLGKSVFPASSKINAFFGLTCRDGDSRQLLLGRSTLKSHLLNDVWYDPDGYFAHWQEESLPMPIHDEGVVSRFKDAFNVKRCSGETGLSIVIPHVLDEFKVSMLTDEVIEHYFYPILNGDLIVRIQLDQDSPHEKIIDRNEIVRVASSDSLRTENPDLADTISLAEWATSKRRPADATVLPPTQGSKSNWDHAEWRDDELASLRETVGRGEEFTINLSIVVESKKGPNPVMSIAKLYGKPVGRSRRKRKSYFTRRGINIADACRENPNGFVFLIEVDDPQLAGMVGAAENPSHTNLSSRDKLRDSYERGSVAQIDFLRQSPSGVAYAIEEDDREPDTTLLSDIFWRPKPKVEDDRGKRVVNETAENGQTGRPKVDVPERKPQMLRINPGASGFTVLRNPESDGPLNEVSIKAAYARTVSSRRKTQIFKAHDRLDFDFNELTRSGLSLTSEGCDYEVRAANEFRLTDLKPEFSFRIEGFDAGRRDLVVDARHIPPRTT